MSNYTVPTFTEAELLLARELMRYALTRDEMKLSTSDAWVAVDALRESGDYPLTWMTMTRMLVGRQSPLPPTWDAMARSLQGAYTIFHGWPGKEVVPESQQWRVVACLAWREQNPMLVRVAQAIWRHGDKLLEMPLHDHKRQVVP